MGLFPLVLPLDRYTREYIKLNYIKIHFNVPLNGHYIVFDDVKGIVHASMNAFFNYEGKGINKALFHSLKVSR